MCQGCAIEPTVQRIVGVGAGWRGRRGLVEHDFGGYHGSVSSSLPTSRRFEG